MTDETVILRSLDEQFAQLHRRSITLVRSIPAEKLYWHPRQALGVPPLYSCGEHILRGAAVVEQTFGGITANLWDDPFEWTLPETLPAPELVAGYLDEVESTRQHGFAFFKADADLLKEIVVPSGAMRTLFQLLAETLVRAAHHQGQSFAIFRLFSDAHLPPV